MIPDPKNYVMKGNKQAPQPATKRIDITSKDELRTLALETLVGVIQANPKSLQVIPALKELLDRVEGKAPQAMTIDATMNVVTVNANVSFIPVSREKLVLEGVDKTIIVDNQ